MHGKMMEMARIRVAFALAIAFGSGLVVEAAGGCSSDDGANPEIGASDASGDRARATPRVVARDASVRDVALDLTPTDGATCNVRIDTPPIMESPHVPEGSPVVYGSNPPSSGPHYGIWANFMETEQPVDDRYLVHSLEHGAVLLLYKCAGAACAPIVDALRALRDAFPTDPLCDPAIRVRIILSPRPGNDVAVAAAAWGATYRADCVDAPSLMQWMLDHYAKAPENFCSPGMLFP